MINYIWIFMISVSLICGSINGNLEQTVNACLKACENCCTLIINITVMMCFWKGFLNIAAVCGITNFLTKLFRPFVRLITKKDSSPELDGYISSNITANLLGLGNAATPFGLSAMKVLDKNLSGDVASDSMCRFIILNTASLQLIPSTVFALRSSAGSKDVFSVLVPIWIVSCLTLVFAMTLCSIFEKFKRRRR